jgi:hypothetical protein
VKAKLEKRELRLAQELAEALALTERVFLLLGDRGVLVGEFPTRTEVVDGVMPVARRQAKAARAMQKAAAAHQVAADALMAARVAAAGRVAEIVSARSGVPVAGDPGAGIAAAQEAA